MKTIKFFIQKKLKKNYCLKIGLQLTIASLFKSPTSSQKEAKQNDLYRYPKKNLFQIKVPIRTWLCMIRTQLCELHTLKLFELKHSYMPSYA